MAGRAGEQTRRVRALAAWFATLLAFGIVGSLLALLALHKRHFPLLEPSERALLVATWGLRGSVTGAAVGLLAAVLAAGVEQRRPRWIGCCAIAVVALATLLVADLGRPQLGFAGLGEPVAYADLTDAPRDRAAPNLVLFCVDTLRRDHLSLYGYGRRTSPALDEFGRGGLVFDDAVAHAPATVRSMAALMTGLYPYVLEAEFEQRGGTRPFLGAGFHTLAEQLAARGYDTAAFVANPRLEATSGFAQGFSHYDDRSGLYGAGTVWAKWRAEDRAEFPPPGQEAGRERTVEHVVTPALGWLDRARPPFFLWIHVMDPHHPYEPQRTAPWEEAASPGFRHFEAAYGQRSIEEYTKHLEGIGRGVERPEDGEVAFLIGRYDAEILQVDRGLERLLRGLRARGYDDENTVVAVTSDHGEEFLEHGRLLHSFTLFEEMLRVPLVLRGRGVPSGARVKEPVQLVDLPATLLELAGAATADLDGSSLLAPLSARPAIAVLRNEYLAYRTPSRKLVVGYAPDLERAPGWWPWRALPEVATIALARERRDAIGLWHLDRDPDEQHNLIPQARAEARALLEDLQHQRTRHPLRAVRSTVSPQVHPREVETLRALGYVE